MMARPHISLYLEVVEAKLKSDRWLRTRRAHGAEGVPGLLVADLAVQVSYHAHLLNGKSELSSDGRRRRLVHCLQHGPSCMERSRPGTRQHHNV